MNGNATLYEYDAAGNIAAVTDAEDRTVAFAYDLNGNLTGIVYPDGTKDTTQYDALGRVILSTPRTGLATAYEYDAMGNVLSVTQAVNKALRDALPMLTDAFDVAHICGKGNLDPTLNDTPGYTQVEFLDKELPDVLACADLVLSRAGSNALMEFQALARPLLLVPYPKGASRGDQILNAQSMEKRGLCHVLLQENMTAQTLAEALKATWAERNALTKAVKEAPPADGTERVLEMIEEVQKK